MRRGGVRAAPEGRALSEMLIAGELGALYSPPQPRRYHAVNGPIVRRRGVWQRNKWIARGPRDAQHHCLGDKAQYQ